MTRTKFKIWTLELCAEKTPPAAAAVRQICQSAFTVLLMLFFLKVAFAQTTPEPKVYTPATPVPPPAGSKPAPKATPIRVPRKNAKRVHNESDAPAEKSIATDARVTIRLCVSEGKVRINGWDRNEIRAFVSDGSEVGFLVRSKSRQNGKPNLVNVLGYDPRRNAEPGLDECLSGNDIEIDVPKAASIDFTGQESEITIGSVDKVKVENVGGNILLNGIARGIQAVTYRGGVLVENSGGAIDLTSVNGNIVAFGTQSEEVGDVFRAQTQSGAVTLQQVDHQQIEAKTHSGSIRFNGEFASGGQYAFNTINGAISLTLPVDSSCKINASYAGSFTYDLPLKDIQKTPGSPIKLTAVLNDGDANLNLTTYSGAIRLRKKQ